METVTGTEILSQELLQWLFNYHYFQASEITRAKNLKGAQALHTFNADGIEG